MRDQLKEEVIKFLRELAKTNATVQHGLQSIVKLLSRTDYQIEVEGKSKAAAEQEVRLFLNKLEETFPTLSKQKKNVNQSIQE